MSRKISHLKGALAMLLLFGILLPSRSHAQGTINFRGDLSYTNSDNTVKTKSTGEKTDSELYTFDQSYNVDLTKSIYPQLAFSGGASFELYRTESKTEGTKSTTKERILSPYAQLALNSPLFPAGINYNRLERKEDISGSPTIEAIRDEWGLFWGWRPVGLPKANLYFNRSHSYDDPKTIDEIQTSYSFDTSYSWKTLQANYVYTRTDLDDRLNNFDTSNQTHFGRMQYGDSLLGGRLSFFTSYRIRYNIFKFSQDEGASAEVPLQRTQGLFSLDNTPEDGPALAVNNALIDGNLTSSAGIDIGLGGDENTLTNIGVDLGLAVDVDVIHIWVDRSLSSSVANYFSWDVYTSPDNTDDSSWTLLATVSPADFPTLENRFEITFPTVNTRFIKVVTRALSPTVPDANNFPNIFVTEMQAFGTVSGEEVDNKITELEQKYNFSTRAKITDKTDVGYNFNLINRNIDPTNREYTLLTNALFANHVFNRIFSASANLTREDESDDGEDTVTYTYGLFLRGAYLPTFNQTLAFSGTSEKQEDDSSDEFALALRNNAILYQGWSVFLDSGYNWLRALDSDEIQQIIFLRTGTNFQPNRKFTMNWNYRLQEFIDPKQPSQYDINLVVFLLPFNSLSLSANLQWVKRTGPVQSFQSYVATWSPFPDGNLQFFFRYSESFRSTQNEKNRNVGPGLSWTISRHFSLEATYNFLTADNDTQKSESSRFATNFRVNF
jgi:hypothetical protein